MTTALEELRRSATRKVALERTAHPKTEPRITPDALGAGGHSGLANVSVLAATAFDWLDDVLEP